MKSKFTLGLIGCLLLTFMTPSILKAQTRDLGTNRQPKTCGSLLEPTSGPISVEQAKIYVTCYREDPRRNYSGAVNFIDILSLQISPKTRRVNNGDIYNNPNIDQDKPIYEIRANVIVYACYAISDLFLRGENCRSTHVPQTDGRCFQNTFGEWKCLIGASQDINNLNKRVPPPSE